MQNLALSIPDAYAGPFIVLAVTGGIGIIARTVALSTRLGVVVKDLERRVTNLESK